MTTSSANVDARSNPTLDCLTDAIILREGPGAVGVTYVRGSSTTSPPSTTSVPSPSTTPSVTPTPSSLGTPTSSCAPPPFAAVSSFPVAAPVIVVRAGTALEQRRRAEQIRALDAQLRDVREERSRLLESAARHARSWWWTPVAGGGIGAAVAALSAVASVRGSLEVAIGACLVAGGVTLAVGVSRIRAAREHGRCGEQGTGKPRAGRALR